MPPFRRSSSTRCPPDRQLDLVRAAVRAARRRRRARGAAGRGDVDGRRVPPSSRLPRPGAERDPGRALHRARRCVLRLPERGRAADSAADELADRLLDEAGVALLAGSAFGRHGADHLRISYASSLANLEEAVERIRALRRLRCSSERPSLAVAVMSGFVDVHSHVVPSGDDGARTIEEGLELCRHRFRVGHGDAVRDAARACALGLIPPHRGARRRSTRARSPRCVPRSPAGASTCGAAGRCIRARCPPASAAELVLEGTLAVLVEFPGSWLEIDDAIDARRRCCSQGRRRGARAGARAPRALPPVAADPGACGRSSSTDALLCLNAPSLVGAPRAHRRAHGLGARSTPGLVALAASDGHSVSRPPVLDAPSRRPAAGSATTVPGACSTAAPCPGSSSVVRQPPVDGRAPVRLEEAVRAREVPAAEEAVAPPSRATGARP